MATRTERMVDNEKAFRIANERLVDALDSHQNPVPFLCECADPTCLARVDLDLDAYREVRSDPNHFFRIPGHLDAPGERVVETHAEYEVVEKEAA